MVRSMSPKGTNNRLQAFFSIESRCSEHLTISLPENPPNTRLRKQTTTSKKGSSNSAKDRKINAAQKTLLAQKTLKQKNLQGRGAPGAAPPDANNGSGEGQTTTYYQLLTIKELTLKSEDDSDSDPPGHAPIKSRRRQESQGDIDMDDAASSGGGHEDDLFLNGDEDPGQEDEAENSEPDDPSDEEEVPEEDEDHASSKSHRRQQPRRSQGMQKQKLKNSSAIKEPKPRLKNRAILDEQWARGLETAGKIFVRTVHIFPPTREILQIGLTVVKALTDDENLSTEDILQDDKLSNTSKLHFSCLTEEAIAC